jgi:hypothetical protein
MEDKSQLARNEAAGAGADGRTAYEYQFSDSIGGNDSAGTGVGASAGAGSNGNAGTPTHRISSDDFHPRPVSTPGGFYASVSDGSQVLVSQQSLSATHGNTFFPDDYAGDSSIPPPPAEFSSGGSGDGGLGAGATDQYRIVHGYSDASDTYPSSPAAGGAGYQRKVRCSLGHGFCHQA